MFVRADDLEAWRTDEEFAREILAGLNPVVIKRLEVNKETALVLFVLDWK